MFVNKFDFLRSYLKYKHIAHFITIKIQVKQSDKINVAQD